MQPPTIREVAKRAKVGVGTVSRVLNGSTQVREETRQRVLQAIEELGFSPNRAAQQLSGGKTFTIGVVSPFFTFPSFVERLAGIQNTLDGSAYDLTLYSIRTTTQMQRRMATIVGQKRVDGLIVLSLPFDEEGIHRLNPAMPIVVVDSDHVTHYPHILIDNVRGGALATEYLIRAGHTRIGFIGDRIDNLFGFTSTLRRFEGFRNTLEEAGLALNMDWCRFPEHGEEPARQAALEILCQPERPTAIFAAIDTLAFGVLEAASNLGLRVPDDLAVIGFDDVQAAKYAKLTTIRQHLLDSGELGARLLLQWLQGEPVPKDAWRTSMPLEIVKRATA